MPIYKKLKALNITLQKVHKPAGAYTLYQKIGNILYLSGHLAKKNGEVLVGQFTKNMTIIDGKKAARAIAIDLLTTLHIACDSDLNRVKQIIKLMSFVNSTDNFTEQHLITNGASELMVEVFNEHGLHSRSACGVVQLPMGACIEIELIAEIM